jgi:hypothetical protein
MFAMACQLWLQEARTVLSEYGAAFHYAFGGDEGAAFAQRLAVGDFTIEGLYLDLVAGHLMGLPDTEMADTTPSGWDTSGDGWSDAEAAPQPWFRLSDQAYAAAMAFQGSGSWTMTAAEAMPAGQGQLVRFITYGDSGAGGGPVITFGGVWQLTLGTDGQAVLAQNQGGAGYTVVGNFGWMSKPRFAGQDHGLVIYEAGPKLVIRNLDALADGSSCGLAYTDPTASAGADGLTHALRAGTWSFAGAGRLTLGCCPLTFVPGVASLERVAADGLGLWGAGSTQAVQVDLWGLASDGQLQPTIETCDQDGQPWPQAPAPSAETPATGFRWSVGWETSSHATYYLSGLDFTFPPVAVSDGNSGTDLLALDGVADRHIVLEREGDLTHERLAAAVFTGGLPLAPHVQPNMSVRYVVDGVTRFRGLSDRAEWEVLADTEPGQAAGVLSLAALGLWKRFIKGCWPGGRAFDGRKLTDCLAELAWYAGLTADQCQIVDAPYTFPAPADGAGPSLVWRPGTRLDRIWQQLREQFFGTWLTSWFRVTDGVLVVAYAGSGPVQAAFYETTAAALAAGAGERVILAGSYHETLDESQMANLVVMIGQDANGQPLVARALDRASVGDPTVFNYVGELWPEVRLDPGLTTQGAVNYACRSLFERLRQPKVYAEWRSARVDLWPGDYVQLLGPNYGGTYVLRAVAAAQANAGDDADPVGRARYRAERVA